MSEQTETQTDFQLADELSAAQPSVGVVGIFSEQGEPCPARAITQPTVVGRDATSAHLVVADTKVSRAHVELSPAESGLQLRDLGSRNGSTLDGASVEGRVAAPVGSLIRIGRSLLLVVGDAQAHQRSSDDPFGYGLVGGPALDAIRQAIARMATDSLPVLVTGETGTGKERVSQAIHTASGRKGRLVAINCAALPQQLAESELFGHERGAFSGSEEARGGLFREADRGTLLLDELGELPLSLQAKLLRVLEDWRVRPVGADREVPVDVRVIGATNGDLADMVTAGRFRADLFHRLAALHLRLPPLRERLEDVPRLARLFLPEPSLGFSVLAMERLCRSSWPGNIRGLRHTVHAAAVNAQTRGSSRLEVDDLKGSMREKAAGTAPQGGVPLQARDEAALRARIETALELRRGNVSRVGRDLGISRSSLYETIKRLGIDPGRFRA